jgi:hypothetical protein
MATEPPEAKPENAKNATSSSTSITMPRCWPRAMPNRCRLASRNFCLIPPLALAHKRNEIPAAPNRIPVACPRDSTHEPIHSAATGCSLATLENSDAQWRKGIRCQARIRRYGPSMPSRPIQSHESTSFCSMETASSTSAVWPLLGWSSMLATAVRVAKWRTPARPAQQWRCRKCSPRPRRSKSPPCAAVLLPQLSGPKNSAAATAQTIPPLAREDRLACFFPVCWAS